MPKPYVPNIGPQDPVPQSVIDNAKANHAVTSPTGQDVFGNPVVIPPPQQPPTYVSSTDVAGQFNADKQFVDQRTQQQQPTQPTQPTKPAPTESGEQSKNLGDFQDAKSANQAKADAQTAQEDADAQARLQTTLSTLGSQYTATTASITSQYAALLKKTQQLQNLDIGRRQAYGLSSAMYDPIGHTDAVTLATDQWNGEINDLTTQRENALQQAQVAYEQGKAGALADSRKEVSDIEDRIRQKTLDFNTQLSDQLKTANDQIALKYQEFDERGKLAAQKGLLQLAAYKAAQSPDDKNKIITDAINAVGGDPNNVTEFSAVKNALDGQVTADAKTEFDTKKNALDLENTQSQIDDRKFQEGIDLANLHINQNKAAADAAGITDPSQLVAYAQQYASTGAIPTGLPKGSFGMVAQFAKESPKPDGTLVDRNTGVKSSALSPTQEDGIVAMRDLTTKLDDLKTLFNSYNHGILAGAKNLVLPSNEEQQYQNLRGEVVDLLARARSGAALTADEVKTYTNKLPSDFNKPLFLGTSGNTGIDSLKSSIAGKLDTTLKAQGVSIYGYSTVNLGGTDYKVGDTIEVNGKKGRVLPDGTIAELPN